MSVLKGHLTLSLGTFTLDSGEFELPLQGGTVLFGRSGSGKSTLLRALSGLEKKTSGELWFDNQVWQQGAKQMPTQQRHIGFVFQDAALFPHMTVRQNLMYSVKRLPKGLEPANFDEIVKRVGIQDKLDRAVTFLSGGEKQRVAIARALLTRPKILCMDEPLSALDWKSKAQIMTLIEEVVKTYQIPVLYITHSPAEVERLADHVVFMESGTIKEIVTLQQALQSVDSPLFTEEGVVSVLEGQVGETKAGLTELKMGQEILWLSQCSLSADSYARVRVLARDVSLALVDPQQLSIVNHLSVAIVEIHPKDEHRVLLRLQMSNGQFLFSEITQSSFERLNLSRGQSVFALIKSVVLTE